MLTLEIAILTTAIHNHLTMLPASMWSRNKKAYDKVEAPAHPHPLVRPLHGEGKSGGLPGGSGRPALSVRGRREGAAQLLGFHAHAGEVVVRQVRLQIFGTPEVAACRLDLKLHEMRAGRR